MDTRRIDCVLSFSGNAGKHIIINVCVCTAARKVFLLPSKSTDTRVLGSLSTGTLVVPVISKYQSMYA